MSEQWPPPPDANDRPGCAIGYTTGESEWISANPGDPLFSTVVMLATHMLSIDGSTWIPLGEGA